MYSNGGLQVGTLLAYHHRRLVLPMKATPIAWWRVRGLSSGILAIPVVNTSIEFLDRPAHHQYIHTYSDGTNESRAATAVSAHSLLLHTTASIALLDMLALLSRLYTDFFHYFVTLSHSVIPLTTNIAIFHQPSRFALHFRVSPLWLAVDFDGPEGTHLLARRLITTRRGL
jgi:hypothetical protein